ncbi:MAG TPA: acyltransferase family protein [Acidimicrobiia bacterium]
MTDATEGRHGPRGDSNGASNGSSTRGGGAATSGGDIVAVGGDLTTMSDEPPEVSNDGARPLRRRYDSLDGLRAIGALAVLVTHVGDSTALSHRLLHFGGFTFPLNGAVYELNLGVEIFFVVSAFLVYRPFLAAHVDGGRHPEPLRFLWRRCWRIYPAYWAALTIIVLFSYKSLSFTNGQNNGDLRVAHYLLVWGYDLRWVGANFGLRQSWTLVVELSFYFFVPIWAWLMRGAGRYVGAMRAEVIGALILLPVSPWFVWNMNGGNTPSPLRVLPPFITAFAIGMLFAALDVWHERRPSAHAVYDMLAQYASWAWAVALAAFLIFVKLAKINPLVIESTHQQFAERIMHAVIAALIAFPAIVGLTRTDGVRRILRWRPLVLLGIVSYGFYLWHYLFLDTLRHKLDAWTTAGTHTTIVHAFQHIWFEVPAFFMFALVGATIMGALSWFLIERPAINFAAGRTQWWPQARDWVRQRVRRPSFYTGLTVISLAALAWRVGYVINERGRLVLSGDAFYYHTQANDIAHGRWFIDPSQYAFYGRVTPSAGHPPTYILYLAAVSKFIGTSELTHRLASTLLGAGAVFFVGVLARMLFNDDRAGWIAAGMAAVYAHMWINDEMLMSEGMYQLWMVIAFITVYRFWRDPKRSNAAWMGAAIAMAALSRAEATTLFPLILIPFLIVLTRVDFKQRIALTVIACVVGALVMAPWLLYNMGRFVHPVVMSNGIGSTVMVANCNATYTQPYLGYWSVACAKDFPTLQHGDESEKEVAWRKQGITYIEDHLPQQPEMVALRVARMWDVGFIGQNIFPFNGLIEGRGVWQSLIATLQYLLLMPLALHGLVLLYRRRVTIIPFLALAATITITAASTFGITRYRAPIDALLPVLAAGAIIYRLDRSRPPIARAGEPLVVPSAEPEPTPV